jgi:hypothetical protein
MTEVNVERVLQMEQEYQSAKQTAIKQLLDLQKQAGEQLRALGHEAKPAKSTKSARKTCSKCNATDHDARAHRGERGKPAAAEVK